MNLKLPNFFPHSFSEVKFTYVIPKQLIRSLPTIPQIPSPIDSLRSNVKTFKIACVDDSPTILDEMHRFLNHEEYEVTKIDDPVKAAAVLFKLKPDLVLMDITMPEINGYKLCSLLRNSVALRETPIVMVTGRSGLVDKARARGDRCHRLPGEAVYPR